MAYWLLKTEPDCYGYGHLEADGGTLWDGISNALAQKHLRGCAPGDKVFIYHTGNEKAIVGVAEVTGEPVPDPEADNPKVMAVPLKPVARLAKPVTLAVIKADEAFADWELVRIGRLSVMPVSAARWKKIEKLAKG